MASPTYVGRFAPSPSGDLHFGSLVAAVGSYLQARTSGGSWLLRMEDLDTPRVVAGAASNILRTLESFGFEWDGQVESQSRRLVRYVDALRALQRRDLVFPCTCSRAQISAQSTQGLAWDENRYPGTCRHGVTRSNEPIAQRLRVEPGWVEFVDRLQGRQAQDVAATSGDFVLQRRDGIIAYHLAVVVDDAEQGITEVVRGGDLLESTPRHILLQRALHLPTPGYCHLPLAVDSAGQKLSKSSQSTAIEAGHACAVLIDALAFLRQSPPRDLLRAPLAEVWTWAYAHWNLEPLRLLKSNRAPLPE